MTLLPWNWLKWRVSAKTSCGCYSHPLDDRYGASSWSSWTSRHCYRNSNQKLWGFVNIRMRSCLLKEQLQLQSTGTSFCLFLWSNKQLKFQIILILYSNFITGLCFSLALIRKNSSHFKLMELFKGKSWSLQ